MLTCSIRRLCGTTALLAVAAFGGRAAWASESTTVPQEPRNAAMIGMLGTQPGGNSCGVISGSADYWLCEALAQRNCGLISATDSYWFCEAITKQNCALARGEDKYWFCEALRQRNCGLARGDGDWGYWMCEGLLQNRCTLVRASSRYWVCTAIAPYVQSIVNAAGASAAVDAVPLPRGTPVNGMLQPGDPLHVDGSYIDRWTFRGERDEVVRLEMTSARFGPYLELYRLTPEGLVFIARSTRTSDAAEIMVTLRAGGQYVVYANSESAGASAGEYALRLTMTPRPFVF